MEGISVPDKTPNAPDGHPRRSSRLRAAAGRKAGTPGGQQTIGRPIVLHKKKRSTVSRSNRSKAKPSSHNSISPSNAVPVAKEEVPKKVDHVALWLAWKRMKDNSITILPPLPHLYAVYLKQKEALNRYLKKHSCNTPVSPARQDRRNGIEPVKEPDGDMNVAGTVCLVNTEAQEIPCGPALPQPCVQCPNVEEALGASNAVHDTARDETSTAVAALLSLQSSGKRNITRNECEPVSPTACQKEGSSELILNPSMRIVNIPHGRCPSPMRYIFVRINNGDEYSRSPPCDRNDEGLRQSTDHVNVFTLIAKHGGMVSSITHKHRGPWSCKEKWILPSIERDGFPFRHLLSDDITAFSPLMRLAEEESFEEKERLRNAIETSSLKCSFKEFLDSEWQHYQQVRFEQLMLEGNVAVEAKLTERRTYFLDKLPNPCRMLLWQNNSCALDAMISILPHVAIEAAIRDIYKIEEDSQPPPRQNDEPAIYRAPVASIIGALRFCDPTVSTRDPLMAEHVSISNWIRHLVKDMLEWRSSQTEAWSIFQEGQSFLDIIDKMTIEFGALLGDHSDKKKSVISVKSYVVDKKDILVSSDSSGSLSDCGDLFFRRLIIGREYPVPSDEIPTISHNPGNGIYVLLLPNSAGRRDFQDSRIKIAEILARGWNTTRKYCVRENEYVLMKAEVLAFVGFRAGSRRDHFISGTCFPYLGNEQGTIYVHDGLRNEGMQIPVTARDALIGTTSKRSLFDTDGISIVYALTCRGSQCNSR